MRLFVCGLVPALLASCSSSTPSDGANAPGNAAKPPASATDGGLSHTPNPRPPAPAPAPASDAGQASPKAATYTRKVLSFDDLAAGTSVTDQFKTWAIFASDPGCALDVTSSAGVASSKPYYLFTYYSCANGQAASMFVDFTKPVRAPRLKLVGVNGNAKVATVRVVREDATTTETDAIGKGNYSVPVVVDLPSEANVKRLEITDVRDAFGLGFDDLEFDFPDP